MAELAVEAVPTVLPLHRAVMQRPDFTRADALAVHTCWIETEWMPQAQVEPAQRPEPLPLALTRTAIEIDGRRHASLRQERRHRAGIEPPGVLEGGRRRRRAGLVSCWP